MPDLSTITPVTREEEFLDRIARAAASPNLPEVDTSDNGDVLTVVSGEWATAAPASCLPEVTSSNNGQVLTVVSGEWAAAAPAAGGAMVVKCTGVATYSFDDVEMWTIPLDTNMSDINACLKNGPAYFSVPILQNTAPYYTYPASGSQLMPFISATDEEAQIFIPTSFPFAGLTAGFEVSIYADEDSGDPFIEITTSTL